MIDMQGEGRRGVITTEHQGKYIIATKTAKDTSKKGAINKEIQILAYLQEKEISFVPQLLDHGDGRFRYKRIKGDHFQSVYNALKKLHGHEGKTHDAVISGQHGFMKSPYYTRGKESLQTLVLQLLERAYQLDRVGVVHGELIRPFTNILVQPDTSIAIIDFERGKLGDESGKNMRSYAQRLLAEGWIDIAQTKYIGSLRRDDIYMFLSQAIQMKHIVQKNHTRTIFGLVTSMLLVLDQVTKYIFYTLERGTQRRIITPTFNTGVGRSLPVPLEIVLLLTCIVIGVVIRGWRHRYIPLLVSVLIITGALGNGIDRVVWGGVRDFIDLQWRPIFNMADIYLSIAVLALIYFTWYPHVGRE